MVWGESGCRSLDDQAVSAAGIQLRTIDARHELSPGHRKNETRDYGEAGIGGVAVTRPELSDPISEQDRQRLHDDAADTARGRNAQFPRGFRHSFRRGKFRVAHRVQQCRQFVARSFQRASARDRVANGDRCLARQHSTIVRF